MPSISFKPASEFSIPQLADLLTRGFEGYLVPIHITEAALLTMLRRDSIDLSARRGSLRASRLAAMGIVTEARNGGTGAWAMERLIEEARERGEKEMVLEVIEQNTAGVRLYQKMGFKTIRRLVGYKLENPQVTSDDELQEIDIRELARLVTYHGLKDLPWQLSGVTISHHTPPSQAFRLNDAYCLLSDPGAERVVISSVLVKARSRGAGLSQVLIRAVFSRFPNKVWHVPPLFPEEMGVIFEHAGMVREEISQWQMSRTL